MREPTARTVFTAGERSSGFVLLELVVAFAVIGLVMSIVWLRMPQGTGPQALRSWAFEVEAMLRDARSEAERTGIPVAVTVNQRLHRLEWRNRRLDLPGDLTPSIQSTSCEGSALVRFLPDGSNCAAILALATATGALRIFVNGASGDVTLAR